MSLPGMRRDLLVAALGFVVAIGGAGLRAAEPADPPQFEREILPILTAHCFKCHGLEAAKAALDLRGVELMLRGGDSGPAMVPGSSAESLIHQRIAERSMPPKGELPLTDDKIERIRRWIDAGAKTAGADAAADVPAASPVRDEDRRFWAFRPLARPSVPEVSAGSSVRTAVDAFIQSRLEKDGVAPVSEAEPRTLARRLSFDLVGLPPAREEVEAFLGDTAPDAYERFVDRLLSSPHFGERWGRYWLDTAGYVDTIGDDTDATIAKVAAGKWRYRDYVVAALNNDKPFDRFLVEQIAGDELVDWRSADRYSPEMLELLIATGYLRSAADETLQNELNTADIRHAVLARTMEVTVGGLLGLTVGCARCHSHKYDPIPQEDYYRLLAVFAPAFNPQAWIQPAQRELPDVSAAERSRLDKVIAEIDKQVSECEARLEELRKPARERLFEARLAALHEVIRADTKAALETPADKRNDVQRYLVEKFEPQLRVSTEEVDAALTAADRDTCQKLQADIAGLKDRRPRWGTIQAVYDVGPPPPFYLLRRGNHETPGAAVEPGLLRVLCTSDAEAVLTAPPPTSHSSGRRMALARWLTAADSPAAALVARVWVNRVWQQLFGEGIVATSDNFGSSGAQPTHHELLDWLAHEFIATGWRTKPLIKLLVTSSAYRRASNANPAHGADATFRADELWSRTRLRQLDSEIIRDAILATSGQLDRSLGGPPIMTESRPDATVAVKADGQPSPTSGNRRSMYLLCRRRYHLSLLDVFGQPEMAGNCPRRSPSAVVSQSLALLNDPFLLDQASHFADRVRREAMDPSLNGQIERAFQLALSRPPRPDELQWATELIDRQSARYRAVPLAEVEAAHKALSHLCHMLFCTNEFLYVQ